MDNRGLVITTNKVAAILDLNTIEKYIKNINIVDTNEVMSPKLSQSKLYLKILDIPYYIKNTDYYGVLYTDIFLDLIVTWYDIIGLE